MTLKTDIDQLAVDAVLMHQIVHGDATTTVTTAGGPVRSVAKLIADKDAEINVSAGGILAQSVAQVDFATQQAVAAGNALSQVNVAVAQAISAAGTAQTYSTALAAIASQTAIVPAATVTGFNGTVVASLIYDTRTDSDGGAWRKRCQNASWYNEVTTATGKWLGIHTTEGGARGINGVLGPELCVNGDFSSATGWGLGAGWTIAGGKAAITNSAATNSVSQAVAIPGKLYQVTFEIISVVANGFRPHCGGNFGTTRNAPGTYTEVVLCGATTTAGVGASLAGTTGELDNISIKEISDTSAVGDYFYNTSTNVFSSLNDGPGTTQVYRGARKEFPEIIGITVEAARVILWDLTDRSVPMWMVFSGLLNTWTTASKMYLGNAGWTCSVYALDGCIILGANNGTTGGMTVINMIGDFATGYRQSGSARHSNNVANRNGAGGYSGTPSVNLVSSNVTSVAATVLPSAPIDLATGLPVATELIATTGGGSWLLDSRVAFNSAITTAMVAAAINSAGMSLLATASMVYVYHALPTATGKVADSIIGATTIPTISGTIKSVMWAGSGILVGTSTGLFHIKYNPSVPTASMVTAITNISNSGWQVGDIQAAITVTAANIISDVSVKALALTGAVVTAPVATGAQLQSFTPATVVTATLSATVANGCHVHWELVAGAWHCYINNVSAGGASTAVGFIDGVASTAVPIVNVAVAGGTGVTIGAVPVANVRFSKTPLSADQAVHICNIERDGFTIGKQSFIAGTSSVVLGVDSDDLTRITSIQTPWGVTEFIGLQAINSYATTVGTPSAISTRGGYKLLSGATGSSFYKPSRLLAEELTRTFEQRKAFGARLLKKTFTATVGQTDFDLGIGEEPVSVYQMGVLKDEGAGAGLHTVADRGFRKTIKLGTGATVGDRVTIFYTLNM